MTAGETLTIEHLSGSVTTSGEQGESIRTCSPQRRRRRPSFLPAVQFLDGTIIRGIVNLATLFTVEAGDEPQVFEAGDRHMVSGADDGCFIPGTETP